MKNDPEQGLVLSGLDGSNPLGFLSAVGVLRLLSDSNRTARMGWEVTQDGWRPVLTGCCDSQDELCSVLQSLLGEGSTATFDIGKVQEGKKESNKFPFAANQLVDVFNTAVSGARVKDRRDVDLLASFGTELYPDKKNGVFQCTSFKMVRSGDSNSQGMLFYAKSLRLRLDRGMLTRTLFDRWDYPDKGYSLRWDPIEDQRYALRWRDPSKSDLADGPGTMIAANCLAVEALRCFPVMPVATRARTTGFQEARYRTTFVWPIWMPPLTVETARSVLSLSDLYKTPLDRSSLAARGVGEVYGVQLIRPNKYYSNFAPALPVT